MREHFEILKDLKETIDSAISFVEIQPMLPMQESEVNDGRRRFGDFDLIIGNFGVKRIEIKKSETADTRTCDFANTSKETLLASSLQHIGDVVKALAFFSSKITEAAGEHDYDKLTTIDWFHADFVTGFKQTGWWDNHRKIHRHHLEKADGVPDDVNLIDVIEYISDCVMAGMARSGSVYELKLSNELLQRAFRNTTELLKTQVSVKEWTT